MSTEQGNANKRLLGEEVIQNAEGEGEAGTPKGSSSNSSDGTNHHQQNQVNSDLDNTPRSMSLSMLQSRPHAISGNSNAEFLSAPHQQQPVASLPSTPVPGTPQSVVPATMDLLPLHRHGQDMNPVPHNQLNIIPQPTVMHNEQFHMPPPMGMANVGMSQIPANQAVQNMRNPYPAVVSNYSHLSSNLPADHGFDTSSRPQVPIGNMPPGFVEQLVHMQRGYQQMANNPSFTPFGPQQAPLQAPAYPTGGPPYHHFLMPTMHNPQHIGMTWYNKGIGYFLGIWI
uniref:Uncharacterized protein n=2 Tax=Vitis vinifera TaxID=29760 RepID=A5AP92_VITVI|nr:hypothetical protein VITISV_006951 [Vitis vinifera]